MKAVSISSKGENKGHYSPGMICGGMLYISGQLSRDPDTGKCPEGGIKAHTLQALSNVDRVLKSAGLERSDVIQCRVYIDNINNWDAVNEVYRDFFGDHKPARAVVPVPALHFGCMVEIEAVADASKAR